VRQRQTGGRGYVVVSFVLRRQVRGDPVAEVKLVLKQVVEQNSEDHPLDLFILPD